MMKLTSIVFLGLLLFLCLVTGNAQSINSGTVTGTVTDPSGAIVKGARVGLRNPVTGYEQSAVTDISGSFRFNNIPQNNYRLTASAAGVRVASQENHVPTSR